MTALVRSAWRSGPEAAGSTAHPSERAAANRERRLEREEVDLRLGHSAAARSSSLGSTASAAKPAPRAAWTERPAAWPAQEAPLRPEPLAAQPTEAQQAASKAGSELTARRASSPEGRRQVRRRRGSTSPGRACRRWPKPRLHQQQLQRHQWRQLRQQPLPRQRQVRTRAWNEHRSPGPWPTAGRSEATRFRQQIRRPCRQQMRRLRRRRQRRPRLRRRPCPRPGANAG